MPIMTALLLVRKCAASDQAHALRDPEVSLPTKGAAALPHAEVRPMPSLRRSDHVIIINIIMSDRAEDRMKVKVTTVGSSAGVVLPKEVLAKLRVRKGDTLYLSETPDGIELSPYDPDFDQELETARAVMRRYRNALRKLAK